MNWRVKGLAQKLLSVVPGGVHLNSLLQATIGGRSDFSAHIAKKVDDWAVFMGLLREVGGGASGCHFFEIGTGWFPTFGLCLHLAGSGSCTTFDVRRYLSWPGATRTLGELENHLETIGAAAARERESVANRYARLSEAGDLAGLLTESRIRYYAPADAADSGLPSNSVDVVFSNSVLEHVAREDISRLMRETWRILRPGGLTLHSVNCGDHYAYFDSRITPINYLTYSEKAWRFWNNSLLYQNRLRPSDFVDLTEQAGLHLVARKQKPKLELLPLLPQDKIAPEFQHYAPEELCCTSVDFVAQKDR